MIFLRGFVIVLWLIFSCVVGLIWALLRWGNLNLDRDFARIFSWGVLKLAGLKVELEGSEHLRAHQPCIFIANHQSGLDMATFGSFYPARTLVIGKKELRWIPFFGLFFMAAGNICINRQKSVKAIAGLSQAAEAIREKAVSIWIFPEGTRNRSSDAMLPFKKGAFYMAAEAGVPIVPIVSSSLQPVVSWKDKKIIGGTVKVRILPPVSAQELSAAQADKQRFEELITRVRAEMIEAFHGLASPVGGAKGSLNTSPAGP